VERLGKVVVGAEFQPLDLVVEGIAGRNDDHRSRAATPLQLFEQPQAAAAGQHDVQQDAVVVVCGDLVERRGVIGGLLDDVLLRVSVRTMISRREGSSSTMSIFIIHSFFSFLGTGGGAKIRS